VTPWQHRSRGPVRAASLASIAIIFAACNTAAPSPSTTSVAPASAGTSAAASTATGSSAPAGAPIVFGDLHPFTGQYASVGTHSYAGAISAAACINDAGGVLGGKLTVTSADTVGDPADAVPALNKLIAVDHAVAIIGPGGLEIGGTQSILDTNKIPFMFEGGLSAMDNNADQYLWRDTPSDSQEGVAMALYALSKGYKKAALVFSTIQSAQDFKDPVKSAERLYAVGTRLFTVALGGPAYDLGPVPGLLDWRDERNRT